MTDAEADGTEAAVPVTLTETVYRELRRMAARRMLREPSGHTLQATALVHEAWMRLQQRDEPLTDRKHLVVAAAVAMRRILIERARRVNRKKHGGDHRRVELPSELSPGAVGEEHAEALDGVALAEALAQLESLDANLANLVSLHYLVGFTVAEAAQTLAISPAKAKKDLQFARRWLAKRAANT